MKIQLTVLATLIAITFSFGQKTKKVKLKEKYNPIHEVFFVLQTDKSIKHGLYTQKYNKKKLISGNYLNNKPVGNWNYYDGKGNIIHTINKDSSDFALVYTHPSEIYQLNSDSLSRPVIILGGHGAIMSKISSYFRYPTQAREMGISARIVIKFEISETGKIQKTIIENNPGYGFKKVCEEIIEKANFIFLPALNTNGNPISGTYKIPVHFKLAA